MENVKCLAIIQVRTGSSRLPGKVLLPFPEPTSKSNVLGTILSTVKSAKHIDDIVIATTRQPADDEILRRFQGQKISRGSTDNVLSRIYSAYKEYLPDADVIVRITGDCPMLDSRIIDAMIEHFLANKLDYLSNVMEKTFPEGYACEIFTSATFDDLYKNATDRYDLEHVTPYYYRYGKYNIQNYTLDNFFQSIDVTNQYDNKDVASIRATLDYPEDYTFLLSLCRLMVTKGEEHQINLLTSVIDTVLDNSFLTEINRDCHQKKLYNSLDEEIKEALEHLEVHGFGNAAKFFKENIAAKSESS